MCTAAKTKKKISTKPFQKNTCPVPSATKSDTRLQAIVNVPPGTFTALGIMTGLAFGISKQINRLALEDLAWEKRLAETRQRKMEEDPTLDERDLIKADAAAAPSAYGRQKQRVLVSSKRRTMNDDEIERFEEETGVEYDPYYDEPYEEDELPAGVPYHLDKRTGDRIYEDGEIFYQDEDTGLYYRQGGRPRLKKFF